MIYLLNLPAGYETTAGKPDSRPTLGDLEGIWIGRRTAGYTGADKPVNSSDYLSRLPINSEQIPLRQATTIIPMARKTTVRWNAFNGNLQGWG
jgi:hypothetical protein